MPMRSAIIGARACRAGLAGLALVILAGSLAEATFGPRTTIGKNYQQWSNTQSSNGIDPGECTSSTCFVVFQPIPQQQPLIVQHVACRASLNAGSLILVRVETRKGQAFVNRLTPFVPVHTTGPWWGVNSPVMHLIKSGERPIVRLAKSEPTAGWVVECSISGKLQ